MRQEVMDRDRNSGLRQRFKIAVEPFSFGFCKINKQGEEHTT